MTSSEEDWHRIADSPISDANISEEEDEIDALRRIGAERRLAANGAHGSLEVPRLSFSGLLQGRYMRKEPPKIASMLFHGAQSHSSLHTAKDSATFAGIAQSEFATHLGA